MAGADILVPGACQNVPVFSVQVVYLLLVYFSQHRSVCTYTAGTPANICWEFGALTWRNAFVIYIGIHTAVSIPAGIFTGLSYKFQHFVGLDNDIIGISIRQWLIIMLHTCNMFLGTAAFYWQHRTFCTAAECYFQKGKIIILGINLHRYMCRFVHG